jgi:hypothetical protein
MVLFGYIWILILVEAKNMFSAHLTLLKAQYCFEKEVGVEGIKVPTLLNEQKHDMGVSFFKVIM